MYIRYTGDDFVIDKSAHSVTISGALVKVRPKTFQLLLVLLDHAGETVDKSYLLDVVWSDVSVEDHVVFQSIAELRKVFGDRKVIQTYPRKGYSWIADVKVSETQSVIEVDRTRSSIGRFLKKKYFLVGGLIIALAVFSVLWILFKAESRSSIQHSNETIFVLPTKNRLMGSEFDWVSLGVMDTLISQAENYQKIMPVDYVLKSMRMANMGKDYSEAEIARLIQIAGVGVVVESEISRRLGDYQLVYKLHYSNSVKRGVFFDPSMTQVVEDLAAVVAGLASFTVQKVEVRKSNFNNEMFVEAIEFAKNGDVDGGIHLLKSLVKLDPQNYQALRLLIDWLQYNRDFNQAVYFTDQALKNIDTGHPALSSFYFRHSYNLYRLERFNESWHYLRLLQALLLEENNPLYLGLAHQLEGELLFKNNEFEPAKIAFLASLKQFEHITYSVGMTTLHCLLAKVEVQMGYPSQAEYHLEKARAIVEKYDIKDLIKLFRIQLSFPEA